MWRAIVEAVATELGEATAYAGDYDQATGPAGISDLGPW